MPLAFSSSAWTDLSCGDGALLTQGRTRLRCSRPMPSRLMRLPEKSEVLTPEKFGPASWRSSFHSYDSMGFYRAGMVTATTPVCWLYNDSLGLPNIITLALAHFPISSYSHDRYLVVAIHFLSVPPSSFN